MGDPIQVSAPDGTICQFPAGTPDEVITSVMAKTYGGPQQGAQPAGAADGVAADVAKSAGSGLVKGAAGLAGLPQDAADVLTRGVRGVANVVQGKPFGFSEPTAYQRAQAAGNTTPIPQPPSAADVTGGLERWGLLHKPQTTAGRYAETIGEFTPGSLFGAPLKAGALARNAITYGAIPGAASEAAGQATEGTAAEPWARVGAGLAGGLGAGLAPGLARRATAPILGRADGMSWGATKHLVDALRADTPQAVDSALSRLGEHGMLADAGPALLGKAQGAMGNSDEARSILANALRARNEGTNSRIMTDVERALGPAEDPQTVTNTILAHRRDVDAQNYGPALQQAPPVDTTGVLARLGPMIGESVGMERRALENLRGMLMTERPFQVVDPATGQTITEMRMVPQDNPVILHKIKGELDNVIQYDQPGLGVPAGALARQQGALKQMRGALNQAIEDQVPGYAEANATSAGLARRAEAVEQGTQYLGSGKTTPSPERFAGEFAAREPGERIAFAKGSRGNIDRILGTKANDLQALRGELQGEGGWNTAKIATVHGDDAAEALVRAVEQNLKFRDTFNKVVEGSQTDLRRSARDAMKPTPATETPLVNPNMTLPGLAGTIGKKGLNAIANLLRPDQTHAYGEIARVLTAQGQGARANYEALADALRRYPGTPAPFDRQALARAILNAGPLAERNEPASR